jgi:hypothetical protein
LLCGFERPGDEPAFREGYVLHDLAAQGTTTKGLQPVPQSRDIAGKIEVLVAKGGALAKEVLIDKGGKAIEFKRRILERCGGEEEFLAVFCRKPYSLADLVALPIGVTEFVGLVNDHQIPGNSPNIVGPACGIVHGADHDPGARKRVRVSVLQSVPERLRVENKAGKAELLGKLYLPLLAKGGRADHEKTTALLSPVLAKDKASFDGLPQSDLIGKEDTLRNGRPKRKQGGLDLVGV